MDAATSVTNVQAVAMVNEEDVELITGDFKIEEIKNEAKELAKPGMISVKRLRSFVGLLSWVCGCLPRIRWVVRILYGLLRDVELEAGMPTSRRDKRPKRGLVAACRAGVALPFALAFWEKSPSTLVRRISSSCPVSQLSVVTDASPWGLGGVLVHAATGQVVSYFDSPLTVFDEETLEVKIGDCAAQGVAELLAVLVAFVVWRPFFETKAARVTLLSDSTALAAAQKLASPIGALNFLVAEFALQLEWVDAWSMAVGHVPGALNVTADFLSRMDAPGTHGDVPACLKSAKRIADTRVARSQGFYSLPSPSQAPMLWERRSPDIWTAVTCSTASCQ